LITGELSNEAPTKDFWPLAALVSLTALPELGTRDVRVDVSSTGLVVRGRF
jgi:hypothetical protein